jgi:3-hydroxybutyryl-CoA dehydrogenase
MAIQTVGVIGAGQMGNGIAHVLSQSGYSVLLNDVNQDALDRAVERVRKNMDRQLRSERFQRMKSTPQWGGSKRRWI